jgi:hypothetical protein
MKKYIERATKRDSVLLESALEKKKSAGCKISCGFFNFTCGASGYGLPGLSWKRGITFSPHLFLHNPCNHEKTVDFKATE